MGARDIYSGIRADTLLRSHITFVRKKIREAHKKEAQRFLELEQLPNPSISSGQLNRKLGRKHAANS